MNDLERFIIERWKYSIDKQTLLDSEYSLLYKVIEQNYPDSEYLQRSWSSDPCPTELLRKYGMEDLIFAVVLTDKTESIPSLESILEVTREYADLNEECTVSMKEDGWNFQAGYYLGRRVSLRTRGRETEPMDVSHLLYKIPETIPILDTVTIVFEATVSHENFKYAKETYGNESQRGTVSTFIARKEESDRIDLHAVDLLSPTYKIPSPKELFFLLEKLGFTTAKYYIVKNYKELMIACNQLAEDFETYETPTDGMVVRGTKTRALRILKWEPPILRSYVTGYYSEYNAHSISLGVTIAWIKLANSTQKQVTCTNPSRVIKNNLRIGAPVAFKFQSGSIGILDEYSTEQLHKLNGDWGKYCQEIDYNEVLKKGNGG